MLHRDHPDWDELVETLRAVAIQEQFDKLFTKVTVDCAWLLGGEEVDDSDPDRVGPWDEAMLAGLAEVVLKIAKGRVDALHDAVEKLLDDSWEFPEVGELFESGKMPDAIDLAERLGIDVEHCREAVRGAIGIDADAPRRQRMH